MAAGVLLAGKQRHPADHFPGPRGLPRLALMVAGVPTEPALADSVRIFPPAIPLAIITYGNPTDKALALGILAIGIVTLAYTWFGGLRAVVWVDVIQLGVYLLGGIATLIVATHLAGGVGAFARAWDAGKLAALDFRPSFTILYTFWGGLVGGGLLPPAPQGTRPFIVQ